MSQITVKEMFDFCIDRENSYLAHLIYWALQQKLVGLQDDCERLKNFEVDMDTVTAYMEQNVLGMKLIKLYVIRDTKDYFAFYFAYNSLEAMSLHQSMFGQAESIVEAPSLMHRLMYIQYVDEHIFLLDFRKRFVQFPVYVGHARANEHYIQRYEPRQVSKVV